MDSTLTNNVTTAADGVSTILRTAIDVMMDVVANDYKQNGKFVSHDNSMVIKGETMDSRLKTYEQKTGTGFFQEVTGERPTPIMDNGKTGNFYVVTPREWQKIIEVPRNFKVDDMHGVSNDIMNFADSKWFTRERDAFEMYRDAFAGSRYKTPDGQPIISNSHVSLKDGSTRDNLETGVLSEANLSTYLTNFELMKDDVGFQGGFIANTLLVAPSKYKDATILTQSELRPGGNLNDLNYYSKVYPGLVVKTNPYLAAAQGGSDTAYFLLSNKHKLTRITRDEWSVYTTWQEAVKARQPAVESLTVAYREAYVAHDFYGTFASNGSV